MKFHLLAIGHRMPAWVAAGFEEYARRMPGDSPLLLREIKPQARTAGARGPGAIQRILHDEAQRLRAALPAGAVVVALDERGKTLTTLQWSQHVQGWLQGGRDVAFLIGGADGLESGLKDSAHLVLSLSSMTLPHQLVRIVLAEQLYRAMSLLSNHPYHRA
ncbi:MAG: 23S rRNA (pseudouridine(1915)-N(3))-methyltransferase RlmH [Burkholderiales bacterium]|nr:23S rRNA (pseudouridine(1915)-N(3))-methyltransferase RlmH [Burkholderiales bacterium]